MNSISHSDENCTPEDELDALARDAVVQPQAQTYTNGDGAPSDSTQEAPDGEAQPSYWRTQLFTVADFLKRPRKQWLVDSVLGERDFALVYGESGHGKTHVLLDFAFACATGAVFADKFVVSRPLTVVYAAGEGVGGLTDRLRAVRQHYGAAADKAQVFILTDVPQLFQLETVNGALAFVTEWQRMAEAGAVPAAVDVLIIDTLHTASAGANENSAQDASITQRSMKLLRDRLGCALVLSHHANKAGTGERGTTALRATMDTVLRTQKAGADKFTMSCEKLKDGIEWPAQAFRLESSPDTTSVFTDWLGDAKTGYTAAATRESKAIAYLTENAGVHFTADAVAVAIDDEQRTSVQNTLRNLRDAGTVQAAREERVTRDGRTRTVWCYWIEAQSENGEV